MAVDKVMVKMVNTVGKYVGRTKEMVRSPNESELQ